MGLLVVVETQCPRERVEHAGRWWTAAALFAGLALNFAFYGAVFLLALFFEQVRGLSALETGLMFLPMTALITVVNLLAGRLPVGRS
jgi:hypothetical protein